MTDPTPEAYEAAASLVSWRKYGPRAQGQLEALEDADSREVVDAVWKIAEATVRAQVAAEIRAECERIRPADMAQFDGLVGMATRGAYANAAKIAARIAEGKGDETP